MEMANTQGLIQQQRDCSVASSRDSGWRAGWWEEKAAIAAAAAAACPQRQSHKGAAAMAVTVTAERKATTRHHRADRRRARVPMEARADTRPRRASPSNARTGQAHDSCRRRRRRSHSSAAERVGGMPTRTTTWGCRTAARAPTVCREQEAARDTGEATSAGHPCTRSIHELRNRPSRKLGWITFASPGRRSSRQYRLQGRLSRPTARLPAIRSCQYPRPLRLSRPVRGPRHLAATMPTTRSASRRSTMLLDPPCPSSGAWRDIEETRQISGMAVVGSARETY